MIINNEPVRIRDNLVKIVQVGDLPMGTPGPLAGLSFNSVRIVQVGVNLPTGCSWPLCRIVTFSTTRRVIS